MATPAGHGRQGEGAPGPAPVRGGRIGARQKGCRPLLAYLLGQLGSLIPATRGGPALVALERSLREEAAARVPCADDI